MSLGAPIANFMGRTRVSLARRKHRRHQQDVNSAVGAAAMDMRYRADLRPSHPVLLRTVADHLPEPTVDGVPVGGWGDIATASGGSTCIARLAFNGTHFASGAPATVGDDFEILSIADGL